MIVSPGDYGFLLSYDESTSASPDFFQYNENGQGGRISIDNNSHDVSGRNTRFLIVGTAIPEPSRALFLAVGLGATCLLRRRS